MKTGINTQDLALELQRRAESAEDYVADTRRMGFAVEPFADPDVGTRNVALLTIDEIEMPEHLVPAGENVQAAIAGFQLNDHAQNQVAQRLGIPFRYFERMRDNHPDILTDTVGKLFVREPSRRMVRTLDGGARAFLSDRYRRLDNYDLAARAVFPALAAADQGFRIMSAGLTDLRLYIKLIWPDIAGVDPAKPGETLHPGLSISNSEVGAGRLLVEPFLYRSYCTNGCIFGVQWADGFGLAKMHVGRQIDENEHGLFSDATLQKDDEAFFAMVHDVVKGASSQVMFDRMLDRLRELAGIKIEPTKAELAVERLAKATNLNEGERSAVMGHLIEGGDLSAFGFWNAVTRTAEDMGSYDRATEIERIGGDMVDWSEKAWAALTA